VNTAKTRKGFRYWHESLLLILLVALLAYANKVDPVFTSLDTQKELSSHLWERSIIAIPMLLIIITGGIDLSVGAMVSLCAIVLGLLQEKGISPFIGGPIAIACGAVFGWMNGLSITRLKIHPLIITLATMGAYRGCAEGISFGGGITGFPESFSWVGAGPFALSFFIVAAIVTAVLLQKSTLGRSLYAIGHSEKAARFSGLNVNRIKVLVYSLAGLASGVAATILISRRPTAKADVGDGWEMDVITAVVLGGASINGGKGNIPGLVLGLLLIHETREFVTWQWDSGELVQIVVGGLLIVSVLIQQLLARQTREES